MKRTQRRVSGVAKAALAALILLCPLAASPAAQSQTRKPVARTPQRAQSTPAGAQSKTPISLNGLLKALGIGGLKTEELIEEVTSRGVAFEMTAENEASLRAAGAGAALVEAARKNYRGPVDRQELQAMLYLSVLRPPRFTAAEIIENVTKRGVNFQPTRDEESQLLKAGATPETLAAVRSNYRPGPQSASAKPTPAPDAGSGAGIGGGNMGGGDPSPGGGGAGVGPGRGTGAGIGDGKPYATGAPDGSCPPGADPSADLHPYKSSKDVTKRFRILSKPEPAYTESARQNNISGTIKLRILLSATCRVTKVEVISQLPDGLTERAIAAARQIRFIPSEKDGRPVSQWAIVEYNFSIY